MNRLRNALRASGAIALAFLFFVVATPAFAQATYTMTLQTNSPSYSGSQPIVITGVVSPAPGANTGVIITIDDQAGTLADVAEVPAQTNGSFSYTSVPGGNPAWTSGTYSVNATWGGNGATASKVVTFTYSPTATTTTTSTTLTTTSSTSTTSTSASSIPPGGPGTSTTTTSSTVPEFPSGALALVALVGVALVAALSRRLAPRPPEA